MSELASHSTDYSIVEREPPEVMARNLRVAAQLWASATVFFFVAFLFAYFYLRSLDKHSACGSRKHVRRRRRHSGTLDRGRRCRSCVVLRSRLRRPSRPTGGRRGACKGAVALALLGLVASCSRSSSGRRRASARPTAAYASVYLGWTGLLYRCSCSGSLYWLETTLATSFRYRSTPMGTTAGRARPATPIARRRTSTTPVARPAGARGARRSTARARRDRRRHLVHPLRSVAHGLPAPWRDWPVQWPLYALVVDGVPLLRSAAARARRPAERRSAGAGRRSTAGSLTLALASTRRSTPTRTRCSGCTCCSTCC